MAEIAMIISATAALVGAVGGVVLAVSKLGPFINAVNKLLAEKHKREAEARKSATIQVPNSITPSEEGLVSKVTSWAADLLSFIAIILQMPIKGPATAGTVAVCALAITTILGLQVTRWSKLIVDAVLITAKPKQSGQPE